MTKRKVRRALKMLHKEMKRTCYDSYKSPHEQDSLNKVFLPSEKMGMIMYEALFNQPYADKSNKAVLRRLKKRLEGKPGLAEYVIRKLNGS